MSKMRPRLIIYFIRLLLVAIFIVACLFIFRGKNRNGLYPEAKDTVIDDFDLIDDDQKYIAQPLIMTTFAQDHCPKYNDSMINVHFILHSHDDPGWLKTAQKYYEDDVKIILDNIYAQLKKDGNRRAVFSEMFYFNKWWSDISSEKKEMVHSFVKNGQLEFVGGGWVQNDDATTHYTANIDQLGYGLRTIKNLFGPKARPVTGWQIDCFGYSKEQASIFAQTGYVAEVIHRIPFFDKDRRRANGQMEFIWKSDDKNSILTHVLYDEYIPPQGFKFENYFSSSHDSITEENIKEKVQDLIETVDHRIKSYPTNHLLLIMGNDFVFKDAAVWFNGVDKIIEDGNRLQKTEGSKYNFFYSNPSCYFKADKKNLQMEKLDVKFGDFFPYTHNENSYWTGYFSSRPTLKRLIRNTNTLLQTLEKFESLISSEETQSLLDEIRDNFFVTFHHDAITGTCKQHVADDYTKRLNFAMNQGQALANHIISTLSVIQTIRYTNCLEMEINVCPLTQQQLTFAVTVFNGHSKSRVEYLRIPVNSEDFVCTNGKLQLQFAIISDDEKQFSPNIDRARYEMIVKLNVPPLGYITYHFDQRMKNSSKGTISFLDLTLDKNYIENEIYKIMFDVETGHMTRIINKEEKISTDINQTYLGYENSQSGAYMLRIRDYAMIPDGNKRVAIKRREGTFFQEIRQTFDAETTQTVRIYENKNYIEIEWTVGPMTTDKELVTRFNADIANYNTSFTDANGRQLIERNTAYPQNESLPSYPTAAKYYPVTSMIAIKDRKAQLTLIPDRPTGGATTQNGSLELMLHRKLTNDDGAGLGEGLQELDEDGRPIVVRGKFWLTLTSPNKKTDTLWRDLAKEMFYSPVVMFQELPNGAEHIYDQWSMINQAKLNGVHLLSVQRLDGDSVLLRFENYLTDVQRKFNIQDIFTQRPYKHCRETVLTGDREKFDLRKYTDLVTLDPLEIKTFVCTSKNLNTKHQR